MRDLKIFDHTSPFYSGNVFIDHRLNCLGNFFMSDSLHLIDFHRNCFTITADGNGEHKTFLIPSNNGKEPNKVRLFCSCSKKGYARCENAQKLQEIYTSCFKETGHLSPTNDFEKSFFYLLIEPVTRFLTDSVFSIKVIQSENQVTVINQQKREFFRYYSAEDDCERLISRISPAALSRFTLMNMAAEFVLSEQERTLLALGHKTGRQVIEDGFWYRLAYHCYREYDVKDCRIEPVIDKNSGAFSLHLSIAGKLKLSADIPPPAVPFILQVLMNNKMADGLQVNKDETELYFRIWKKENEVCIGPVVKGIKDSPVDIDSRFIYGSYLYIPEYNRYFVLSYPSLKLAATGLCTVRKVKKEEFSSFLEKEEERLSFESQSGSEGTVALDLFANSQARGFGRVLHPVFIESFDRIELKLIYMVEKDCILSVSYCAGNLAVSLAEIIDQKKKKNRFILTDNGIIDLASEKISSALIMAKGLKGGEITLSKAALLQLRGTSLSTRIHGEEKLVSRIREMLEFKPLKSIEPFKGLKCTLREYQKLSVQWLFFLYDNHFGGLLCDEMGLGKTIQIITFLLGIREQRSFEGAFLVVCPTSVISHWEKLLKMFTPSLKVMIYHTSGRESLLNESYDLLLTSYGILRNDYLKLAGINFDVAVFDEVHQLKNKETLSFQAAVGINARMKIGLTGTPVQNRVSDLKSLFDLVLPGLLGRESIQDEQYLNLLEQGNTVETHRLKRMISPFIMRRLKETVLKELPEKIEDIRSCKLSDEQQLIYNAAVKERGGSIIEQLKSSDSPIPYMHIFALFSFLKQVCDHPALAAGKPEAYELYSSGKWDLFTELLDESLESGQKVVVFSQFVGMVEIIGHYLQKRGVGYVSLTGSSKKRERIIQRFAEDNQCRVFVGSLMAGGVGIDLVAGSVVIHYDRWWNFAREDQATDRVHRIGQKSMVQVFKLMTEGTLEEQVDRVIERKRSLSQQTLVEDSPDTLKIFSREELVELLSGSTEFAN